ncbi:MAG TPA: DUF454 domain-containing protein [Xanthomonadaceae bacterium]|jgi:uncharacterized membrane protein YbaN (DUF454 family)|nr:DUF454 domain-containing protein [Xanthomonadaceae bacterium]
MWIDLRRALWIAVAYLALGLGLIGIVLPGLPTTPFILLAAWAAARSSRTLHAWLLGHRVFGPMVRDWQERGAVSRRAKRMAVGMMAVCALIMFATAPAGWMAAIGTACMSVVALWLWRRPE